MNIRNNARAVADRPSTQFGDVIQKHGASPLTLYGESPTGPITLQDFETFAFDRLLLLKELESIRLKGGTPEHQRSEIQRVQMRFQNKEGESRSLPSDVFRRKDCISHFVLRLAFCHTEELRSWFRRTESDLFRFRFEIATDDERRALLEDNGLAFDELSSSELAKVEPKLVDTPTYSRLKPQPVYKVCFTEALDLIARRRIIVEKGVAFVPNSELVSLISTKFRAFLSKSLMIAYRAIAAKRYDTRLESLLLNLSVGDIAPSYQSSFQPGSVKPDQIPSLAKTSFPLCMQHLHEGMMTNKHLRYHGREQFGLFLKGIGLSLDDALLFFRTVFNQKRAAKNFEKTYSYNIRYHYGKEGKRQARTALSCAQIINNPGPAEGDYHGCPFRHLDENHLTQKLRKRDIRDSDITLITKLVKEHHYQLACKEYFRVTHNGHVGGKVGNHPNEYMEESVLLSSNTAPPNTASAMEIV